MNTRKLTGGRDRDKGWTQNDDGNWTPSVYDRRRVAVQAGVMLAEAHQAPVEAVLPVAFAMNAVDQADFNEIVANFNTWASNLK